jgi:hypothetical protein
MNPEQQRANLDRLMVLSGVTDSNPLWVTIVSYADEHVKNCLDAALAPGLSNDLRQFETGRAAGAADFAQALRDLLLKARQTQKG